VTAPSTVDAPATLAGALALAANGWHVFPLRPDDKRPAIPEWEQRATADPSRITAAWTGPYAGCGIGLACGPSRLLVVDLDVCKHEDDAPPTDQAGPGIVDGQDILAALYERHGQADAFPLGRTPTARTGSGGMHVYFAAPADRSVRNSAGKIGWKVDVRANGGYVVAPPSTAAGRPYLWDFGTGPATPLAAPPPWLVDLAAPPAPPVPGQRRAHHPGAPSRFMAGLLRVVLEAHPGERNSRLFWAACKAFEHANAGHVDQQTAAACLRDAALAVGLDEREARSTITSAHRATTGRTAA
jgi:hypothetical protein